MNLTEALDKAAQTSHRLEEIGAKINDIRIEDEEGDFAVSIWIGAPLPPGDTDIPPMEVEHLEDLDSDNHGAYLYTTQYNGCHIHAFP
uniref:Uncharacterized protein n=1 Tax=Candidatus Kentrum sp. UNK TaxID=2126344 RepID=A0A451B6S3_9GAMM|nr:MAG: hypothetical protein BECKUNK1418G_GA0071005_14381 [Candidatus Kentron sp. UNK]VFK73991.1 MAG: hypothetical protein BECKUNK1418H_GA0071006_14311 [Candidatus Kentron sp. UNK]